MQPRRRTFADRLLLLGAVFILIANLGIRFEWFDTATKNVVLIAGVALALAAALIKITQRARRRSGPPKG